MNNKRMICLFLVLVLMLFCLSGCRGKKDDQEQETEVIEIVPPAGQQGLTVDEEQDEIVVPEDSQLGGEELP